MTTRCIAVTPLLKGRERQQASARRSPAARLEEAVSLCHAIDLIVEQARLYPVAEARPATLLGQGQVTELAGLVTQYEATLCVFDAALTPMQQRNLERELHCKVIDRTALILEIFGKRARSREGRLQVELAAMEYQKSRLVRSWTHLERQRGGYGFMGGPGESQIETDRRLIQERIHILRGQLRTVERTRGLNRKQRLHASTPLVALVGYTNAGKSTLFNALTQAEQQAEDALFATLDPTIRRVAMPRGQDVVLSDTVGFIADLPTQLIAAFHATLEEVRQADLLLHVRDMAHPVTQAQRADVLEVIRNVCGGDNAVPPMLEVWNKCDLPGATPDPEVDSEGAGVAISAREGTGLDTLRKAIHTALNRHYRQAVRFHLYAGEGKALAWLHQRGVVEQMEPHESDHLAIDARLSPADIARFCHDFGRAPVAAAPESQNYS